MKKSILFLFVLILPVLVKSQTLETFHDFQGIGILGDTINFSDYAGKKVLVVNTASFCGYTPQFADLVTLDSIYGGPGFAIIGFPCNDFGGQDPNSDSAINGFCTGFYNVAFQMMSKIEIIAPDTAEVYKWLQLQARNGVQDAPVTWNFNKFCIDELGRWVHHFPSPVNPLDTAITNWINSPSVLGISQPDAQTQTRIIENPVKDKITCNLSVTAPGFFSIKLFDAKGILTSTLFEGKISKSCLISFPVKNLKGGMYFVKISGDQFSETHKILVSY